MFSDDLIEERKNNPDSEFYYYPFFAEWLWNKITKFGTDHKLRWCLRDTIYEFDIVAGYKHKKTEKYTLFSIEVKMNNFPKLLSQGWIRHSWFDYCYIAFPKNTNDFASMIYHFGKEFNFLKEHGLGVLLYDDIKENVEQILAATKSKKHMPWKKYKQKIINKLWDLEIQPDPIVVGPSILDFIPELKAKKEDLQQ